MTLTPTRTRGRRWLRWFLGAALAMATLVGVGVAWLMLMPPKDIRPPQHRHADIAPARSQQARALLAEMAERHGGLARYRDLGSSEMQLTDTWPSGLMRRVATPWQQRSEGTTFRFTNQTDDSELTLHERQDLVWGIEDGRTYTRRPDGPREYAQDDAIRFWLPTLEYFVEMPFRINEASVVDYFGERTLQSGDVYDLVYATWNRPEPQRDLDQYILWINRSTGRLEIAQYTVRDAASFLTGVVHYQDFRTVDGITLGHRLIIGGEPGRPEVAHQIDISDLRFVGERRSARR